MVVMNLSLFMNAHPETSDIESLFSRTKLSLPQRNILKIDQLELFPCLQILDLSFNSISVIENIYFLPQLLHFNIAKNKITSISPQELPPSLRSLDISGNPITCNGEGIPQIEGLEVIINAEYSPEHEHTDACREDELLGSLVISLDSDELLRNIVQRKTQMESISLQAEPIPQMLQELKDAASFAEESLATRSSTISRRMPASLDEHERSFSSKLAELSRKLPPSAKVLQKSLEG